MQGYWRGKLARVSWDAGVLGGDVAVVTEVLREIERREWIGVPPGPYTPSNQALQDPIAVAVVIDDLLTGVEVVEGKVPQLPELPPGAIA